MSTDLERGHIIRFALLLGAALIVALGACSADGVDGAAEVSGFYTRSVSASADIVYDAVYHSLEEDRFWVIAEPNIGMTLARNKKRWGEDYNRNGLDSIRSMVFCNPWYANQLSNEAPEALALCPFTVMLLQAGDEAVVTFARPTALVGSGPARQLVQELEVDLVTALDRALDEVLAQGAER